MICNDCDLVKMKKISTLLFILCLVAEKMEKITEMLVKKILSNMSCSRVDIFIKNLGSLLAGFQVLKNLIYFVSFFFFFLLGFLYLLFSATKRCIIVCLWKISIKLREQPKMVILLP